jgi:hypothetical protein
MRVPILPLSQYSFMAWCSVKKNMGKTLPLPVLISAVLNTHSARLLARKREGKRPLGRLRRRWEDNIMMDCREIGWEGADWIHQAQKGTSGGLSRRRVP